MAVALAPETIRSGSDTIRKVVVLLGVPIDVLDMEQTLARIDAFVETGRRTGRTHQVVTVNADFVVNAIKDPEVRFILQEADLATADGMPIVWGARLLGVQLPDRVAGADMVPLLAERAAQKGHSIFLLGAAPGVAEQAASMLCARYPDLHIAGVLAPPFSPVLEMEHDLVEAVKAAQPDILLVAFGNPKQEKWMAMHRRELGVPVMIGVGGSLDFLTGTTQRAPRWMQRMGLEWLHRMLQDPGRLWRRYFDDFFVFGAFMLRQWWAMRSQGQPAAALPLQEPLLIGSYGILPVQGRLIVQNLREFSEKMQRLLSKTPFIVVDLSQAEFLDSSAIGSLVHFAKEARAAQGELTLAAVPEAVAQVLELLRLDQYFLVAPNTASAIYLPNGEIKAPGVASEKSKAPGNILRAGESWAVIPIPRRFDGDTAESIRQMALKAVQQNSRIVMDFTDTVFLASAGLAVMAELHRRVNEVEGQMVLTGCSPEVYKVIQLVKFDQFLTIEQQATSEF